MSGSQDLTAFPSCDFMRFFHNTPMAIATIDREGRIVRTNPLFARLFLKVLNGKRPIGAVVAERDRSALEAATAAAAHGKTNIAPIEAALAGDGERFGTFYVTTVEEEERDQEEVGIVYTLVQKPKPPRTTRGKADPITQVRRIEKRMKRPVITYSVGDDGRLRSVTFVDGTTQHQQSDAERELAEFEARHGKA